ncbi:MAG: hypothetical protein AUJ92_09315 [Armatimonadetes bacterium CG2_30_59_28]|nr:MAG: hypothetical protein AUJ92_09315 [Armatimonadetes bacterium CG2_30_59_28]PIU67407.1 MAG: type II secretion system protein GspE [Armatimonadetes bacterium CG07_land_8_20_14_0_80_59_28]PIY44073.1 MAG: type II secretion system protein GspE [Armatimonadetes bacterium CG_4_10_14_3_um_filter_59_10]
MGDQLGLLAVQKGLISIEQWELIEQSRHSLKGSAGELLINMGLVEEGVLYQLISAQIKIGLFVSDKMVPDLGLLSKIPPDMRARGDVLPVRVENGRMFVAMEDPTDIVVVDDLRRACGQNVVPLLASPRSIARFISGGASVSPAAPEGAERGDQAESRSEESVDESDASVTQPPAIRLVNVILREAVESGASDIHIEPGPRDVVVRNRVDGMLHDVMTVNKQSMLAPLVVRVKVMAEMDIAESRKPQDGQFRVRSQNRTVDIRVSSLPTIHGEKLVLRLLDRSKILYQLRLLGMSPQVQEQAESAALKTHGLILVSGPTGSGKTTTLYSLMNHTQSPQRNIISIEDPVEYVFPRVNQVQVNRKAGMTFASVMRHILRQDPDIIVVGEIRDPETAKMAVEAAMTGHLVLSTIHTNDAASSVTRLVDMGIEPFLVSAALSGILAQRLIRRVCDNCRQPDSPSEHALANAGIAPGTEGHFYRGKGCEGCRQSGYRGRTGIYEFLSVNEDIRELVIRGASVAEIREDACRGGMVPLRQRGLEKVLTGLTTLEEVARVAEQIE